MRESEGNEGVTKVDIPTTWPDFATSPEEIQELPDPKMVDKKDPTLWKRITDPREVEYYIQLRNRLHFGQAKRTPFAVEPLKTFLDWQATSEFAEQVLEGTEPLDSTDEGTQAILDEIHKVQGSELSGQLSMGQFRSKIKIWRESTSTSPSGRHNDYLRGNST